MAKQKDEVGPTGIYPPGVPAPDDADVLMPGEINDGQTGRGKEDAPPSRERLPRKGDELDDLKGRPTD